MNLGNLRTVICCAMFSCVVATTLRTKLEVERVCPATYGSVIAETSDVASLIGCSTVCAFMQGCRSFLFDPETGTCKINEDEASSFPTTCSATVLYGGWLKGTSRQHWMFESCSSDATCTAPASHCSSENNVCTCVAGYAYLPRTDTCVAGCNKYGRQFLHQLPGCFQGLDDAFINGVTMDECKGLCIAATGFVCRMAEYNTLASHCYLTSATLLSNPTANVIDANHCFTYMRTCA